jgi:pimeloyl-ACP methyl ester carboxylesterase
MPRLADVRAPTLMVVGGQCAERLKRHAVEMNERMPRSKIVELEGFGYGIHFLAPDAVATEVRGFLREHGIGK